MILGLLLVLTESFLFGLRSVNPWANCFASAGMWGPPGRWLCPPGGCGGAGLLCPPCLLPPVPGETFGVGARIAGDLNARLQKSLLW